MPGLEHTDCPLCGKTETRSWGAENGYSAVRCLSCGLVYLNPRPPLEAITEAAQTGVHQTETGGLDTVSLSGFKRSKVSMFESRLRDLFPDGELLRRPVNWLDIGTGYGELLLAVDKISAPGSQIEGVEPCAPKVAAAKRRGLQVSRKPLRELNGNRDVVSLVNVFSHLPDPTTFLQEVAALIKPDGNLILVTGNGADLEREQYPGPLFLPDHLVFAGREHVREFLERAGFCIVRVREYEEFELEPMALSIMKNVARVLLKRPRMSIRYIGPFRSLFVLARLETEGH